MTRTRITTLAALLLAALFLTGCGGSGGGEPTVTQTLHDELQAELDAALADLEKERKAKADEEAARETAEGEVTRLRGELETATDNVTRLTDELATATTGLGRLTAQLATANNNVESLTDRIGTTDDADSLQGMLAAEKARVTTLMNQIGTAPGGDDTGGSGLRKDLADAEANVARLTAQIGTAEDADSLQGMLKAEKDEVTRLTTLIGAEANEADADGSLYAQLKYAKAEVMRLTGEIGTASDSDSLKGMLEAEKLEVIRLKSQVITLNERITGLQSQLADARTDVTDAEQRADQTEREADQRVAEAEQQAETQADVIVRAPLLITKLTGLASSDAATEAQASVTHMPGESRTFIRPSSLPPKGSAPSVPGGWNSASFSGPRGTVGTDTVYLYTNIQAPGSKAFWKEHGKNVPDLRGAASDFTGTPKVTVSGFGTQAKELYPDPDGGNPLTSDTSGRSIGGTYDGYSGTFTCDSACDISADDDGALTFESTWTFTASRTAKRPSSQAELDTEYLYFGIWTFDPTNPSGTDSPPHDFEFVFGGDATDITNFGTLTGTATFAGGAVGKYALEKVGGRAAKIGTFTATATFSATFDDNDSTISGRITAFKDGGGSSLGSNWHVFLGASASTAATLATAGVTGGVADGSIDGDSATGAWGATLHGSDNHIFDAAQRDEYPLSGYPVADLAGVAGWFEAAAGTNAAIAGAFGAVCTSHPACVR